MQDPFHFLGHGQLRQKRAHEAALGFTAMFFPNSSPYSPVELILPCPVSHFSPQPWQEETSLFRAIRTFRFNGETERQYSVVKRVGTPWDLAACKT